MKNQNGFSAVIVLLALILISVVSFAGYYVWNENKTNQKASEALPVATVQKTEDQVVGQKNKNVLLIKEWNVEIPNTETNVLSYKLRSSANISDNNDVEAVAIYSKSLDGVTCKTAEGDLIESPIGISTIYRTKNPNATYASGIKFLSEFNADLTVKLGDAYYFLQPPQGLGGVEGCSIDNFGTVYEKAATELRVNQFKQLKQAQ